MDSRQLFNPEIQLPFHAAPRQVCGGQVALRQVFLRVFRLSLSGSLQQYSVLISPHVAIARRTEGEQLNPFKKKIIPFRNWVALDTEILPTGFYSSKGRWYFIVLILIINNLIN